MAWARQQVLDGATSAGPKERSRSRHAGIVGLAAVVLLACASPANAALGLTLSAPPAEMPPASSTTLQATVDLDCTTATQWSVANAGATSIPIAAASGGLGYGMNLTGPASIALPLAPCQTPGTERTTGTASFTIAAAALAPAATPVGGFVHVTLPAAAVGGQTVVPSDSVNRSVTLQVAPVLSISATAPVRSFNVTSDTLDFSMTFVNLGNVPLQIVLNTTSQAVLELPVVNVGTVSNPASGPANVTAAFRFHAPLGSWEKVQARIEVTPQLQRLGDVLHGTPVVLDFEFHNQIPSDKKSPDAGPLLAVGVLALAALLRRRMH